jgi:hypothetical protein
MPDSAAKALRSEALSFPFVAAAPLPPLLAVAALPEDFPAALEFVVAGLFVGFFVAIDVHSGERELALLGAAGFLLCLTAASVA